MKVKRNVAVLKSNNEIYQVYSLIDLPLHKPKFHKNDVLLLKGELYRENK